MPEVRPIDANALMRDVIGLTIVSPEVMNYANAVAVAIANALTIDYEPVIHAYWMDGAFENSKRCSACKRYASKVHSLSELVFDYERCPYCGAHMDAKEDDNA